MNTTDRKPPSWAKAVIVAELERDDSDVMTDYFNTVTERTLILGFSKHTRDLFSEMRNFAATCEEVEHLGPGCGMYSPVVLLDTDFESNGAYYRTGQPSPWHRDLAPKEPFRTEAEAQAFIDSAEPLLPMHSDGSEVQFKWHIRSEKIEHREKYSMGAGYYLKAGLRYNSGWIVRKVPLSCGMPSGEWRVNSKPKRTASHREASGGIEKHTHTKHGFDMWIVTLPDRVDRAEYERLLAAAKSLGGWYSRRWANSPSGFAFKDQALAEQFAAENLSDTPPPNSGGSKSLAEKFRGLADSMQKEIDGKLADRLTNTPKRQREAAYQRNQAIHLQRTQSALRALADLHERGECPAEIALVTSKKEVHDLCASEYDRSNCGCYDVPLDLGKPSKQTPESLAVWALLEPLSESDKKLETLRRKVESLQRANIPGYFPTPGPVVRLMLDHAEISPEDTVLEPSAGSGAILDLLPPNAGAKAYEQNYSLHEVLKLKGYDADREDFLTVNGAVKYDRVVMNPPFERLQDIEHVMHAFGKLKDGGRLVSIMSPGPFFRSDSKAVAFRQWFEQLGGEVYDVPAGSFMESGTDVASKLVVINK